VIFVIICQKVTVLDTKSNVICHPVELTLDHLPRPHRRPRSPRLNRFLIFAHSHCVNLMRDKLMINCKLIWHHCHSDFVTLRLCYPPIAGLNFQFHQFHYLIGVVVGS